MWCIRSVTWRGRLEETQFSLWASDIFEASFYSLSAHSWRFDYWTISIPWNWFTTLFFSIWYLRASQISQYELIVWEGRGNWKDSNFRLFLPRARGNGDRIFHLLMLVTPKPQQTLGGGGSLILCFEIRCNSGDDWTNEENMTYLSRPKPVMCLSLLGRPAP